MIQFNDWQITPDGSVIARQFDNQTRTLVVQGDIPDGWSWALMVESGKRLDIISLTTMGTNMIGAELTADMLAVTGRYVLQLRGTQGERVRHTNKIVTVIPSSMSGDVSWPVVPSEFTQTEQRVLAATDKYPRIGDHSTWLIWDVVEGQWIDTGVTATGGVNVTADDALVCLNDAGILQPLTSSGGALLIGLNGAILTL